MRILYAAAIIAALLVSSCGAPGVCGTCKGKGKNDCTLCEKGGNLCKPCGGKGRAPDDPAPCQFCAGKGVRTCELCKGSGWRTCEKCGGTGK